MVVTTGFFCAGLSDPGAGDHVDFSEDIVFATVNVHH